VGILVFALALPVFAGYVTTRLPIQDTVLHKHNPTTNYDYSPYLFVTTEISGDPPDDWVTRGLLEMDISDMPAGATITQATLDLYYIDWSTGNPVGNELAVYKLINTAWVETEATWNIYSTGNNWFDTGGDFVTSSPSGDSVTMPAAGGVWLEWDITDIVADAYDLGIPVELILKFDPDITGTYTYAKFDLTAPNIPILDIFYTVPDSTPVAVPIFSFMIPIVIGISGGIATIFYAVSGKFKASLGIAIATIFLVIFTIYAFEVIA
jgi:hypothetical protein